MVHGLYIGDDKKRQCLYVLKRAEIASGGTDIPRSLYSWNHHVADPLGITFSPVSSEKPVYYPGAGRACMLLRDSMLVILQSINSWRYENEMK